MQFTVTNDLQSRLSSGRRNYASLHKITYAGCNSIYKTRLCPNTQNIMHRVLSLFKLKLKAAIQ
jgi:hypothetical protein